MNAESLGWATLLHDHLEVVVLERLDQDGLVDQGQQRGEVARGGSGRQQGRDAFAKCFTRLET